MTCSDSTRSTSFKIVKKNQLEGFHSLSIPLDPLKPLLIPSKLQVNLESDGILFLFQSDEGISLIFLDVADKTLNLIDSVYIEFLKKIYFPADDDSSVERKPMQNIKWLDRSFSLSDWTGETETDDSISIGIDGTEADSLKRNNKLVLKKN